jgi:hypothetical protein
VTPARRPALQPALRDGGCAATSRIPGEHSASSAALRTSEEGTSQSERGMRAARRTLRDLVQIRPDRGRHAGVAAHELVEHGLWQRRGHKHDLDVVARTRDERRDLGVERALVAEQDVNFVQHQALHITHCMSAA